MGLLQRLFHWFFRRNYDSDEGNSVLLVVSMGPDGNQDKLFNDVGWFLDSERVLLAYTNEVYARETARLLRRRFVKEATIVPLEISYPVSHSCLFLEQARKHLRDYPGHCLVVVCEQPQAAAALSLFLRCETDRMPHPEPGDVYQVQVEVQLCQCADGAQQLAAA